MVHFYGPQTLHFKGTTLFHQIHAHVQSVLANSEDPDEMLQNMAFHQGLHCLLRQNPS